LPARLIEGGKKKNGVEASSLPRTKKEEEGGGGSDARESSRGARRRSQDRNTRRGDGKEHPKGEGRRVCRTAAPWDTCSRMSAFLPDKRRRKQPRGAGKGDP